MWPARARLTRRALAAAAATLSASAATLAPLRAASTTTAPAPAPAAAPEALPLRFLSAGTCLAHPEKKRGEDAYFLSARALGVADGVGGWAELGIDPGDYARALMVEAQGAAEGALAAAGAPPSPLAVLQTAHAAVRLPGSSTACLLVAGARGELHHINVGDSGVQLWRYSRPMGAPMPLSLPEAGRLWSCAATARMTTHEFNHPGQLAADAAYSDRPASGEQATWGARGGELLLLATDGVWDNLSEQAIRGILARFDFAPCHAYARLQRARYEQALRAGAAAAARGGGGGAVGIAQGGAGVPLETRHPLAPPQPVSDLELADRQRACQGQLAGISAALALGAQRVGVDRRAVTPFSLAAARAGHKFEGGKLDDATVVAALVTADPEALDVYAKVE
jgi:protein phosphatase PTC7